MKQPNFVNRAAISQIALPKMEVMMNLQREAYLSEYQRQLMADERNHQIALPKSKNRLRTNISHGLRRLGQIRGIHIHVSFDWKEPAEQMRRANA